VPDNNLTNNIQHVRDGEPVNSAVTSRATQQLQAAVRYLKDRLDAAELGETLIKHDVTLAPDVLVGSPVYYRQNTQRYEAALADIEFDAELGTLVAKESCNWVGVVVSKQNSTLGDIMLAGAKQVSLSNAVSGAVLPGRYFLSSTNPGKLTREKPAIAISVLVVAGDGTVFIDRQRYDFLEDHVHYQFELDWRPAGEVGQYFIADVENESTVEIVNPDASLSGWLPADHPVFNSSAPANAVFGYNLSQDPAVSRVWPPVPLDSVSLTRFSGDRLLEIFAPSGNARGAVLSEVIIPRLGNSSLISVTNDGIWWMNNQAGYTPWPVTYHNLSINDSDSIDYAVEPNMVLSFSKMSTLTDRTVVTSLIAPAGSAISVENCDGEPASTGALKVDIDLDQLIASDVTDVEGHLVFKELSVDNQLVRGPVCEGLVAGTNIILSSTHPDGSLHQGTVTINALSSLSSLELFPSIIRLSDLEEDFYQETPHVFFPSNRASYVTFVFAIPAVGIPSSPRMQLRLVLLGRSNGTIPNLPVKYRRIARPTNPTALPLPAADASLTFNSSRVLTADQYAETTSAEFVVAAGDTVLVRVSRAASDGYSGHIGMLRASAIISQAS
jgi:hypothetical protein